MVVVDPVFVTAVYFYASATKHLGIGMSVGRLVGLDTTFKKVHVHLTVLSQPKHIPACRSVLVCKVVWPN